jgi:hypothetical protein
MYLLLPPLHVLLPAVAQQGQQQSTTPIEFMRVAAHLTPQQRLCQAE